MQRANVCQGRSPAVFLRRGGFTLLEVVVTVGILAVGVVSILGAFVVAFDLIESSRNMTQAMADAHTVLEQIRLEIPDLNGFNAVRARSAASWDSWVNGLGLGNDLSNERIRVIHGLVSQDPWPVTVEVQWEQRGGRNRDASLSTWMTHRRP